MCTHSKNQQHHSNSTPIKCSKKAKTAQFKNEDKPFLKRKNEWRTKKRLIIPVRLIQMKILRYHLMSVRRDVIKKSTISQAKGRAWRERNAATMFQRM